MPHATIEERADGYWVIWMVDGQRKERGPFASPDVADEVRRRISKAPAKTVWRPT
jgi:hypothetical protein